MIPNKQEKKKKDYLKAIQKQRKLWSAKREIPARKLPKKHFIGHKRFFVVRRDILKASFGAVIQKIVDACNTYNFGHKKKPESFEDSWFNNRETEYCERFGGNQGLRTLSQKEFDNLDLTDSQKQRYFIRNKINITWSISGGHYYTYTPNIPRWMLDFAYKAVYQEYESVVDPEIESEIAKLDDFMNREHVWEKVCGNNRKHDEWLSKHSKLKELKKAVDKAEREDNNA